LLNLKHALDARLGWTIFGGLKMENKKTKKIKIENINDLINDETIIDVSDLYKNNALGHCLNLNRDSRLGYDLNRIAEHPMYRIIFENNIMKITVNKEYASILKHNIEKLLSKNFEKTLYKAMANDKPDDYYANVLAYVDKKGRITDFTTYPAEPRKGRTRAAFIVDMGYAYFDPESDDLEFLCADLGPVIGDIMLEEADSHVNHYLERASQEVNKKYMREK